MDFDFITDKFNVTAEETKISGDYRFGKELSYFLKEELQKIKTIGGKDKYREIKIKTEKEAGWFLSINDNFFKVDIYIMSSFLETEMKEDKTPLNILDLTWTISPTVYINLFSLKTYMNVLLRKNVFNNYFNELCMDIEKISKDNNFKQVRILN